MEKRTFESRLGDIWLWGEADAFQDSRPIVLAITGAFNTQRSQIFDLQALLPEAAVLIGHLPGNHCPNLISHSVGAYAAAYSEVVRGLARPVVAVGSSIGALVTLAIRAPNLAGIVALEPPIRTGHLWPLVSDFRRRLRENPQDEQLKAFIWTVFGISADAHEDRNYANMLAQLTTPTFVVFGSEPLFPQRPIDGRLPSLVDEPERALLRGHPSVRTVLVQGAGHNLAAVALDTVVDLAKHFLEPILDGDSASGP